VHWPYDTSEQTRRELGERLGIQGKAAEILEAAFDEARRQGATGARSLRDLTALARTPRLLEIASQMRAHYLGAVADLDRDFAGFAELLRTNGILDAGYLVFTSDHGEAFAEHGALFHTGTPFEEQTRIPLLIAGRSISPRSSDQAVSHLDLAPTLLEMAGLGKPLDWPGRSLLSPPPERPVLSFRALGNPGDTLAVLERGRKVLCVLGSDAAERRVIGAFDLAEDAREEHDLAPGAADWPRALLEKHAALLALALEPVVEGEAAELDDEAEDELRALGY
jgi:arylsulfatase A-like enzyme